MKLSTQLVLSVGAVPKLSSVVGPDRPSYNGTRERGDWVGQCGDYYDSSSDYENSYYSEDVCRRECSLKPVGDDAIEPFIYGPTNWIYKVYGTEKLGKKKVKKSYRAVIQIEESNHCDDNSLQRLRFLLGSNPSSKSSSIQPGIEVN